jgi:hypothetical protein
MVFSPSRQAEIVARLLPIAIDGSWYVIQRGAVRVGGFEISGFGEHVQNVEYQGGNCRSILQLSSDAAGDLDYLKIGQRVHDPSC